MATGKRTRQPEEAQGPSNKYQRRQKELQKLDRTAQQDSHNNIEKEPGRPGPSSDQAPQAGSHHSPPVQKQAGRKRRQRPRPEVNPPSTLPPLEQPKARYDLRGRHLPVEQPPEQQRLQGRRRPRLRLNPPKPPTLPDPSQKEPIDPESSTSETSTCYSRSVSNYDVEPGFDYAEIPQDKDFEYWGHVQGAVNFIRSSSGLEESWVGVRPLGKGGNGIAGLWELRGDDGRVIDQMVVKEEAYARKDWRKHESVRKVPAEVKTMSKLNKARCHAIPRLINYKRYSHVFKHRMYMEYCPFKDLLVLLERYKRFRQHLPELFLWDTFYHLVEAAYTMRKGVTVDDKNFEFVHRDIKPGNIFLGWENPQKGFPFYPVAKLGDYGLAVMTNSEDPLNPHEYQGHGTPGYFAPEQEEGDIRYETNALSSHTNIWAIGVTMFELLTMYRHQDYMCDPAYNDNGMIKIIETKKDPEYSQGLIDLVKSCIEPNPSQRIRIKRLRASIRSYRQRMRDMYEHADNNERAAFEYNSLLYYLENEINNMPPGTYEPQQHEEHQSRPESGKFPDREYPVVFPRFPDGPEVEKDDFPDDDVEDVDSFNVGTGEEESRGISDGGRASEIQPNDAPPPAHAIREDGGVEGLEDTLTDGLEMAEGAGDEDEDDGSLDMDLQIGDPVSPPPPAPAIQAPVQVQAQAQLLQHPLQAQAVASALPPAPAPAPAPAPTPAPAVQPVERKLRGGKVFGYF